MTDLELTRLCAQAMGYEQRQVASIHSFQGYDAFETVDATGVVYWPLTNDVQAIALVKKFKLGLAYSGYWSAYAPGDSANGFSTYLNRAIVECVAKMQAAK